MDRIPISPTGAALVTGASRRIGLRLAERLAAAGHRVALHSSAASQDETEAAAERLRRQGHAAAVVVADLADPAALPALVAQAISAIGPLSLLVNCASVFAADDAASFSPEQFDRHIAVNLRAPVLLTQAFAAQIPANGSGAVVNVIDQRVLRPTPQFFTYTLSKAALWTATQTMAQAYAPRLRVNAVGPGPVFANPDQGEAGLAHEVAGVPLERAVDPDDIADAVLYLAQAATVTGQLIAVDAGQHLGWKTPDILL